MIDLSNVQANIVWIDRFKSQSTMVLSSKAPAHYCKIGGKISGFFYIVVSLEKTI